MASSPTRTIDPSNPSDNRRRQLNTALQRLRRQSMTEEQREELLSRRRSNYHQRRYGNERITSPPESVLHVSNVTPNSLEGENNISRRREQRRLFERQKRHTMTNDERITYLAQRREAYRRRTRPSTTSHEGTDDTMIQQMYHVQPIPYQSLTSNFLRGSTSTNYDPQGTDDTMIQQMCNVQPIPYQSLTSNFVRGSTSTCQQPTNYAPQVSSPFAI
ncbi:uncharacterized protein [Henckelia pumila]|uniref:uncharacterized protein n=1 Tax=Henckelia pumila TaxID=405737 RepID=UPI003C6E6DE9